MAEPKLKPQTGDFDVNKYGKDIIDLMMEKL